MNILIIEDNLLKREKIVNFLNEFYTANIVEAASYNSGLSAARDSTFDFLILKTFQAVFFLFQKFFV